MSARRRPHPDSAFEEQVRRAYRLALARISRREYGAAEMREYLLGKDVTEDAADAAVAACVRERLIDDRRYAEGIVRRQALSKKGPTFIRAQLRAKGVELTLARVREIYRESTGQDEVALARAWVERKFPDAATDPAARRKAYTQLIRRGFPSDVARKSLPSARGRGAALDTELPEMDFDDEA